jgi:signal transduction histidine kinase
LALTAPLGGWGLSYYAAVGAAGGALQSSVLINALIGLLVLAAVVSGLTYYFYREQSREMREAAQRVTFVNQVSHELKTPLTNIRMYAEMLEDELADRPDEASARHLSVIVSESQRLSRLIGNILTFSRKQRLTLTLHRSPGIVDDVLRETLKLFAPALEAEAVAVKFEPGAGNTVSFDRDALEQIVGNLIGNVEKYGASGGQVRIVSRQRGDTVTITVADEGPGIALANRESIFQPFFRGSDSITEGVSGSGIGLAVARDLARLHGGDLVLEETSMGASFRLTLHCPPVAKGDEK